MALVSGCGNLDLDMVNVFHNFGEKATLGTTGTYIGTMIIRLDKQ